MDPEDGSRDVVHPEVRAHVNSLVAALGGASAEDDGRYKLGDDALEVLRDLKRWIRFYDEKTNRMDVARCLAEANLVEGDLLPILAAWNDNAPDARFMARVALACLELLVPLTWPLDRDPERMTVNHHRHVPVLRLAQLAYKRAAINYDGTAVLGAAVRVALPAVAVSIGDRTPRDHGIIRLALFFLRNVAAIVPAPSPAEEASDPGDDSQVSRSATVDAFAYQDVFLFLLTVASNMGDDFRTEDVAVMEIVYHLVKRVDPAKLFMDEQQLNRSKARELSDLLAREAAMLKAHRKGAGGGGGSGRHNRFGAMIWVKREGNKMSTVSGPDALVDSAARQRKMDDTKTYRPPRKSRKQQQQQNDENELAALGPPAKLNSRANGQLRGFVEEFLDSAFNPLFQHVRKTIDRDAPHLLHYHSRQFFYLVAWFLQAERVRRKRRATSLSRKKKQATATAAADNGDEVNSFNLVAGVLNQEMFVTLSRGLHAAYQNKEWGELTAVMRCFTEILLTVQEMREHGGEDDQEIAENILARLFYEDATHDCVASIARTFKDQGFDYLDAATELTHHFLRILEAYSKQNTDMQVRSRKAKRRRKRKTAAAAAAAAAAGSADNGSNNGGDEDIDIDADVDNSEDDEAQAERITRERKFDFSRFAVRFAAQGTVDTFVALAKFYRDLNDEQLKRAHRYFYRVAFKQDAAVMLYRADVLHLLHGMIRGPEPLDKTSTVTYGEWEELARQLLRRCVRKVQERPHMLVELLFSKTSSTAYFLEKGHEKPGERRKTQARPAAELEFRHVVEEPDRQVAIVVGAMLDKGQGDLISWVKEVVAKAESERRAWTEPAEPPIFMVRATEADRRTAVFKNAHLRLLMKLCHITRLTPSVEESPDSAWVIDASVAAGQLKETLDSINRAEFSPPVFDDGELAEHQLRRKAAPRKKRAAYDDDDDDDDENQDQPLFPAGGPTRRKDDNKDKAQKGGSRKRRSKVREDGEDEAEDEAENSEAERERRRKRRQRELEKAGKIKSALFVTAEDDESDEEYDRDFFAREEQIRRKAQRAANVAGQDAEGVGGGARPRSPGSEGRSKR